MSSVTNIILACSVLEKDDILNQEFKKLVYNGTPFNIVSVNSDQLKKAWYGGTKYLECNLYIGAYNYMDLEKLITDLKKIKWEDPDFVQLIVKLQDDDKFKIIDLFP